MSAEHDGILLDSRIPVVCKLRYLPPRPYLDVDRWHCGILVRVVGNSVLCEPNGQQ